MLYCFPLYFILIQYLVIEISGNPFYTKPIIKTFVLHRIIDSNKECPNSTDIINTKIHYKPYFFTYSSLYRQLINYYYVTGNKNFTFNNPSKPMYDEVKVKYLKFNCDISRNIKCNIKPHIVILKFLSSGKKFIHKVEVVLRRKVTFIKGETKNFYDISTFQVDKCIDAHPQQYYVFGPGNNFFNITKIDLS
uniref:Peptidase S1 domain-containing protein n=1 Tax=Strongyloides stercoralis TaxID=6248 RepID=A0A0K0E044_STRER